MNDEEFTKEINEKMVYWNSYPELLEEMDEDNDIDQITITIYQCYTVVALFCIVSILAILGWVN